MADGEKITILIDAATEPLKRGMAETDRVIGQSRQRIDQQMRQIDASFARVDQAAAKAGGGIRNSLNAVSLQMQDVVVQLAAGTNPLQVLIQQGGQIAGAFGPAFGPAGLLIAGAGAAALAFSALTGETDALKASADAADRTAKALNNTIGYGIDKADDLAARYRTLTAELREFERVSIASAQRQTADAMDKLRRETDTILKPLLTQRQLAEQSAKLRGLGPLAGEATTEEQRNYRAILKAVEDFEKGGSLTDLTIALDKIAIRAGKAGEPIRRIADALVDPTKRMNELVETTKRLTAQERILLGTATANDRAAFDRPGGSGGGKSDAERQAERIRERIAALQFEAEQIKRTAREQAIFQALQQAGVDLNTEAGRRIGELAARVYDLAEAKQLEAEATKQATAEAEAEQRAREAASKRAQGLLEQRDAIGRSYQEEVERNRLLIEALQHGSQAYQEQILLLEILQKYRALGMPLVGEEIEQARELARTLAQQRGQLQEAQVSSRDFALVLTSGLDRAMQAGEGLRGVLAGILEDLAKIATRKAVMAPLSGLLDSAFSWVGGQIGGALFGGGGSSGMTRGIGDTTGAGGAGFSYTGYGGPRASGGPVAAGTAYMVGEKGPELFIPRIPGGIVPNHALGGMGGGDVIVNNIDQRPAGSPPIETTEMRGPNGEKIIQNLIRAEVKKGLSSGAFDRDLGAIFGMRRRGRL